MKFCVLAAAAAAALSTPALAAGSAAPAAQAYFDIGAGGGFGNEWGNYFTSYSWTQVMFHGAARAAFMLAPNMSLQVDAWANHATGNYTADYGGAPDFQTTTPGIAAHLSWHGQDNDLFGAFVSVGQAGYANDEVATVGLEAVRWMGRYRLYGQAGYSQGFNAESGLGDGYVEGVVSYYATPNLVFTGALGYDHASLSSAGSDNWAGDEMNWLARLEFKKMDAPASFYVVYQGWAWTGSYPAYSNTFNGTQQEVLAGVRVPFGGGGSIQNLDQQVGLTDMDPMYGDIPH